MEKEARIILLNGEVNEQNTIRVILEMLILDKEDPKSPISLYINSPGGAISYGLAIYDTIRKLSAPVATVCYGMAASMGAFLLSCGAKGKRYALPNSRILIHQPRINLEKAVNFSKKELEKLADGLNDNRKVLEEIMAKNIGISVEQISRDCENDNWMSADEALKYGIIDGILMRKPK